MQVERLPKSILPRPTGTGKNAGSARGVEAAERYAESIEHRNHKFNLFIGWTQLGEFNSFIGWTQLKLWRRFGSSQPSSTAILAWTYYFFFYFTLFFLQHKEAKQYIRGLFFHPADINCNFKYMVINCFKIYRFNMFSLNYHNIENGFTRLLRKTKAGFRRSIFRCFLNK